MATLIETIQEHSISKGNQAVEGGPGASATGGSITPPSGGQGAVPPIYRYKFDETIMTMITQFAKLHQFDDRKTYKEQWQKWFEENVEELNKEIKRLQELGYEGDILDKMFKAGRYYFRKKTIEDENKEEKKRRNYITIDNKILKAMDNHINRGINNNKKFKPSNGYDDFCENNVDILEEEIRKICIKNVIDSKDLVLKIKKTYKNRYYRITSGLKSKSVENDDDNNEDDD